jgi:RHS repeat-associated protein
MNVNRLTAGGQTVATDVKANITTLPVNLRPAGATNALNLTWDPDNKLRSSDIDANGTADVNFQYDALGRRVARSGTGGSVVYVQMNQQTIADYPVGGAATTPTFRYVYASYIDEPVVRKTAGTGGTLVYFHRNHQYSITAVTTSAGAIAERYAYSAYGQPTILDASASVLSSSAINNRYTYTGREWDATLGVHHFRARWMSPSAGRFLGRDPIGFEGSGSLLYDFLRGDTLEKLDPSGLIPITCECQCAYGKANQNSPDGSGRWLFYTTVNCNGLAATCCSNACNNLNCRDVLIDYGRCGGKKVVRQCDNCVFTGHWRAPGHPFTPSTGDCSIPDCVIGCNFSAALAYALCRRYASESICRFAIGVATTQCIVSCFRRCKDPCSWIAPGIQPCYW